MSPSTTASSPEVPTARRAAGWWVVVVVAAVAFVARLVPTLAGGGLNGLQGYDGSVYYAAAVGLAHGQLPYRDFLLLHPPGIAAALLPFALLGRLIGDPDAFVVARLAWMGLGALNAVLVSRILRTQGLAPALLGGLGYAVFLPALAVEHSTALEGVSSLCLLGAILLLSRPGVSRTGSARPFVLAGVLLGTSAGVKIWGVLVLLAVLVWCVAAMGRRLALHTALGAGLGVTVVCLPFFLAAPQAMWRMVVLDQLGRRRVPVPWLEKLRDMAGLSEIQVRHDLLLVVVVLVALVVGIVLALGNRPGRLAAVVFVASWLALATSPSWSVDYASLGGPALTVMLGSAAATLLTFLRRRWLQVAAVVVLLTGLGAYSARTLPNLEFGAPFPAAELRAGVLDAPGCVTSDDPSALILTGVVQRNLERGCPLMIDLGGYSYDLQPGADLQTSRARNQQWQEFAVRHLGSGGATMVVRFRNDVGLSPDTLAVVRSWPEVVQAGEYAVQIPGPRTAGG